MNDVAHLPHNHLPKSKQPFPEGQEAAVGCCNACCHPGCGVCRLCMLAASQVSLCLSPLLCLEASVH